MSVSHNIEEIRDALKQVERDLSPALKKVAERGDTLIGARAVSEYMVEGLGEFIREKGRGVPRSPDDPRPLRKLSNRLNRAVSGNPHRGVREFETTVSVSGGALSYEREITVPYANVHEQNPKYEYLGPAIKDEAEKIREFYEATLFELINTALS